MQESYPEERSSCNQALSILQTLKLSIGVVHHMDACKHNYEFAQATKDRRQAEQDQRALQNEVVIMVCAISLLYLCLQDLASRLVS